MFRVKENSTIIALILFGSGALVITKLRKSNLSKKKFRNLGKNSVENFKKILLKFRKNSAENFEIFFKYKLKKLKFKKKYFYFIFQKVLKSYSDLRF